MESLLSGSDVCFAGHVHDTEKAERHNMNKAISTLIRAQNHPATCSDLSLLGHPALQDERPSPQSIAWPATRPVA